MATEEQKIEELEQNQVSNDFKSIENPAELLQNSLKGLDKFGGFQLVKGLIKDIDRMDPRRRAAKNIFLTDSTYADSRKKIKGELETWISILNGEDADPINIIDACKEECEKAETNLKNNLFAIHDEVNKLEVAYRTLDSFFTNAGQGKIDCLTLMNVNKDEIADHNSDDTLAVRDEIVKYYDTLNLKNNYSLLVIPGYLGDRDDLRDNSVLRMWAETAYKNKVLLVTDFVDSLDFQMLKEQLDNASLQGQEVSLANTIMTCNYILARKKSELADEDDDLYVPGSAALAGRMSNTDDVVISQGVAGRKYGTLNNVKGARLELRKSELAALIDEGVVPMVEEDGRTMAFSNRSLYNGSVVGLQEYPIVRVFDWVGKVFQDFFNDEAFTNWNSQVKLELQQSVHDFLSDYKGPGKLFENYNLKGINQDPKTKDISIQVEIKPFFAAKNFLIELTGHNDKGGIDWDQNVQ